MKRQQAGPMNASTFVRPSLAALKASETFFSKSQCRSYAIADLLLIDDYEVLQSITDELAADLKAASRDLQHRKARASAYGDFASPQEFALLMDKKAVLGSMHQKLLRRGKQLKLEKRKQDKSFEHYFVDAAKMVLDDSEFVAIVKIAHRLAMESE